MCTEAHAERSHFLDKNRQISGRRMVCRIRWSCSQDQEVTPTVDTSTRSVQMLE